MSDIFYYFKKLKSLPDISKWDTSNAINMSWMFRDFSSLISLQDLSKCNIHKARKNEFNV